MRKCPPGSVLYSTDPIRLYRMYLQTQEIYFKYSGEIPQQMMIFAVDSQDANFGPNILNIL